MGKTAYDIVMEQREKIVEKIISNMEKGYIFTPKSWNKDILRPQNPISNVKYNGANRLILGYTAIEKEYKDPRWLTYKQAQENNLRIKKDELKNYTICEKWIWTKEIDVEDEENKGKFHKETITLNKPIVMYFRVYNGEQIENMPELEINELETSEITRLADDYITSSACKIEEVAQERSFYSPTEDKIVLPIRNSFTTDQHFLSVLWHEMAHSTGHKDRLNRDLSDTFGSTEYAKEELRAELSAVFLEAEYGLENKIEDTHTNYFNSWIKVLKDNPKELFFASNDASKITDCLINNYEKVRAIKQEIARVDEQIDRVRTANEELKSELEALENENILPEVKNLLADLQYPDELVEKYKPFICDIKDNAFLEENKAIIKSLTDLESIDSKAKVFINWSENPNFKEYDILTLQKANEICESEQIRLSQDLGYDKVKFTLFFPGENGKYKFLTDRIDLGDSSQKNLCDFLEKFYKIDTNILLDKEVAIYFKENPFSESLVDTIKRGTLYPEAIRINEEYNEFLKEAKQEYEELLKIAPEEREKIEKEYNLYVKNTYLNKLAYYKAQASIPNWTVTGRGNYNFSKLEKRNEREMKAFDKLTETKNKWIRFKKSIESKIKKAEKKAEMKSIAEKLIIGSQNPVKFHKAKIGNIDCYRSENYIIVKHYSAFTVLSKQWESELAKQENIWQLHIPSSLDNRRFSTLRDAKYLASYLENNSETAESESSKSIIQELKDKLYTTTKEMYKSMINEDDIENPKSDEYKNCKKETEKIKLELLNNGVEDKEQEEIISSAKKDFKEEIKPEVQASKVEREIIIEQEIFVEQ
ncbi:MAG: DUF1738 domain-containing protein [Clostridia bacterium]|nr:DUF1738 domain-containing protein [Clostridia bacterium]